MTDTMKSWHHRPAHVFEPNAMYFVTAGTFHRQHYFHHPAKLQLVQNVLFEVADSYEWKLQAWALFSNHYHLVAQSPVDAKSLSRMIQRLHSQTARQVNRMDGIRGRRVWFQYWDTCLIYERSYFTRLNYVHNNPVKHNLVSVAEQYPFCSEIWFRDNAKASYRRKVESFRYDKVNIDDDFDQQVASMACALKAAARLPHSKKEVNIRSTNVSFRLIIHIKYSDINGRYQQKRTMECASHACAFGAVGMFSRYKA